MNEGQYIKELEDLNRRILEMGGFVEKAIDNSLAAFERSNLTLARAIVANDQTIDEMELAINEKCLTILALYQPVASDLRFITTAMQIVTDLERIGDLACEIAKGIIEMENETLFKLPVNLTVIVDTAKSMVHQSLNAYIDRDTNKAKSVTKMKKEIDSLKKLVYHEMQKLMIGNSKYISCGLPMILIIHHLERIAGHAANIAEDVVYMVNAEVIKHQKSGLL